ncbi:MAG: DUF2851 family protein [Bacteroidales bacterium]|jgi:hypothetical protein
MKEEFLHYLWKYSLYDTEKLVDDAGKKITVIHPGEYNRDSGPDFFNARLIIGGTEWAGNVEIHTRSSHFDSHGHNLDHAFDNVILHVVAENDRKVFNSKGVEILTASLAFNDRLYDRYLDLVNNPATIACQQEINKLDHLYIHQWLGSLVIERLQEKSEQILRILTETGNDWEETFYRLITRYFGFRVNTEPFEMLAAALPFRIIRKHSDSIFQIEALLYGTAGMLNEELFREALSDDYYVSLIKEYKILSAKYSLNHIHGWLWKFSRLRPANFPTLRISQLASLLTAAGGLFSRTLEAKDVRQMKELFNATASGYWDTHFVFGRKSRKYLKSTGLQATDILLINAVIPAIFVYGKYRDSPDFCERALLFLEETDADKNTITDEWKTLGINVDSAFISQGLIQLRNSYCRKRRCLDCRIGNKLISMDRPLKRQENLMLEP